MGLYVVRPNRSSFCCILFFLYLYGWRRDLPIGLRTSRIETTTGARNR